MKQLGALLLIVAGGALLYGALAGLWKLAQLEQRRLLEPARQPVQPPE